MFLCVCILLVLYIIFYILRFQENLLNIINKLFLADGIISLLIIIL